MAETKNNFIKSKMNKDIDARLIPNGEYRDAVNIQVSRSEGPDVGAVENIVGNSLLTDFGLDVKNLEIIGFHMDTNNDRIFAFLTNWNDSSGTTLSNHANVPISPTKPSKAECYIAMYSLLSGSSTLLIGGSWLNFSKTHPITGTNIVENQFYFTDNRNQPRKFNVDRAISNSFSSGNPYYYNEDHVSVAKYYPYEPIKYYEYGDNGVVLSTMKDVVSKELPLFNDFEVSSSVTGTSITLNALPTSEPTGYIRVGMSIAIRSSNGSTIPKPYPRITNISSVSGGLFTITVDAGVSLNIGDVIIAGANPFYEPGFQGDKKFLKDKFIKLSYRFKFDDNEYSPIAPFSQDIFIPEQDGYFQDVLDYEGIGSTIITSPNANRPYTWKKTDRTNTLSSSIVSFMENKVNQIGLTIPSPNNYADESLSGVLLNAPNLSGSITNPDDFNDAAGTYNDVSYVNLNGNNSAELNVIVSGPPKPGISIQVVNGGDNWNIGEIILIPETEIGGTDPAVNVIIQLAPYNISSNNYGSFSEIVDKLKVKEIDIIYKAANDLSLKVLDTIKQQDLLLTNTTDFKYTYKSKKPIRTLPESELSRVYDKVPIRALTQESVGNRVVYGNFVAKNPSLSNLSYTVSADQKYKDNVSDSFTPPVLRKEYQNHTLKGNRTYQVGVVLVDRYGRHSDVILSANDTLEGLEGFVGSSIYSPYRNSGQPLYDSAVSGTGEPNLWPGNSLKVLFQDVIPETDSQFGYPGLFNTTNPLGWYSFKIVVKQQEQEYYNVYLPGILNGYPKSWRDVIKANGTLANPPASSPAIPTSTDRYNLVGDEAFVVLINDNINKIPRDLKEVGAQDKQFASSVELYGRVNIFEGNNANLLGQQQGKENQYYPSLVSDEVTRIGNWKDLGLDETKSGYKWASDAAEFLDTTGAPAEYGQAWELDDNGDIKNSNPQDSDMARGISPFYSIQGNSQYIHGQFPEYSPIVTESNPLIGQVTTEKAIGIPGGFSPDGANANPVKDVLIGYQPGLGVYETKPVFSNLDIFYETSTSGLIAELNSGIVTNDNSIATSFEDLNFAYTEGFDINQFVTTSFYPLTPAGSIINSPNTNVTIVSVLDGLGNTIPNTPTPLFDIVKDNLANTFRMRVLQYKVYTQSSFIPENYTFNLKFENLNSQGQPVQNFITISPDNRFSNLMPAWDNINPATGVVSLTDIDLSGEPARETNIAVPQLSWNPSDPNSDWCQLIQLDGINGSSVNNPNYNLPANNFNDKTKTIGVFWLLESLEFYWPKLNAGAGGWQEYTPDGSYPMVYYGGGQFGNNVMGNRYIAVANTSYAAAATVPPFQGTGSVSVLPQVLATKVRALNILSEIFPPFNSGNAYGSISSTPTSVPPPEQNYKDSGPYVDTSGWGNPSGPQNNPTYWLPDSGALDCTTTFRAKLKVYDATGSSQSLNRQLTVTWKVKPGYLTNGPFNCTTIWPA